ncbi:MAG: hypothetical protein QOH60_2906 [Mycobacterium sp.]|jgi:hypothetical protein|nr:hypothetical protein [Mycobacterium sp.]
MTRFPLTTPGRSGLAISLISVGLAAGCTPQPADPATTPTSAAPTSTAASAPPPAPTAPAPRSVKWVDLAVGDCMTDVPQVDVGELMTTVVDCATAHKAEVFARAPMWVDSTVPDVANRTCVAEFPKYTGRPLDGSPYAVSYLVDSGQDRTGNVPDAPGTAICLLADANAGSLTKSARG